jgi:putative Mg2+ transporter-C (MgtC) family protein
VPFHLGWQDEALRRALTFFSATLIGIDRGEHRRPVGLRTTLLLCLASMPRDAGGEPVTEYHRWST